MGIEAIFFSCKDRATPWSIMILFASTCIEYFQLNRKHQPQVAVEKQPQQVHTCYIVFWFSSDITLLSGLVQSMCQMIVAFYGIKPFLYNY